MSRLKVDWFPTVTGAVDEALAFLPECEMCPRDVYRSLLSMQTPENTRIAVISDAGTPIAVSGMLRRSYFVWEPLTNWHFPGLSFPATSGRHVEALAALGVSVPVAWWRVQEEPPSGSRIDHVEVKPTYRMTDLSRREQFWKSTDYLRHIKNIRNRTAKLEVRVGATEFVRPIVSGWCQRWLDTSMESASVEGRVKLAEVLEPLGKHITVALLDDGKLIAGSTNFVHRGMMVAGVSHLEPEYRKLGAGVRMIDAVFNVAEERGLAGFDLGGGADYKQKWAPENGQRAKFTIVDPRARWLGRAEGAMRRVKRTISGAAAMGPGAAADASPEYHQIGRS